MFIINEDWICLVVQLLFKGVSVAQRSSRQVLFLLTCQVHLEHLFVQSWPNLHRGQSNNTLQVTVLKHLCIKILQKKAKTQKKEILTRIWTVQDLNAGQNLQHPSVALRLYVSNCFQNLSIFSEWNHQCWAIVSSERQEWTPSHPVRWWGHWR